MLTDHLTADEEVLKPPLSSLKPMHPPHVHFFFWSFVMCLFGREVFPCLRTSHPKLWSEMVHCLQYHYPSVRGPPPPPQSKLNWFLLNCIPGAEYGVSSFFVLAWKTLKGFNWTILHSFIGRKRRNRVIGVAPRYSRIKNWVVFILFGFQLIS